MASTEFVAVTPGKSDTKSPLPEGIDVATPETLVDAGFLTPRFYRSWQSHQLPPPTDLVVRLQHFVI